MARALARRFQIPVRRSLGSVRVGTGRIGGAGVVVGIPQTFMNQSGEAAAAVLAQWPVPPSQVLVVCDDVALPLGIVRIRPQGSDGGHRGLRSVIEAFGTPVFPRLRVGIRAAEVPKALDTFVLAPFSAHERRRMADVITMAVDACVVWIRQGAEAAMNQFNRKGC